MPTKGTTPTITIDPLQPQRDHWLHAEATQGDVAARIDIRPYPDPRYPGGYVLDYYYDRANPNAAGSMGRNQEERAKELMQFLGERVREAMEEAGWRILAQIPAGKTVWHFVGTKGKAQEEQLAQAALLIWRGRYPYSGSEKVAPLADFPIFRALITKRWYQVGEGLEVEADYGEGTVQVRRERRKGTAEHPKPATRELTPGSYHRIIHTRRVTFTCAWCQTSVTQERFPGPKPVYCSAVCKAEAQRDKMRVRVQRFREKQRPAKA